MKPQKTSDPELALSMAIPRVEKKLIRPLNHRANRESAANLRQIISILAEDSATPKEIEMMVKLTADSRRRLMARLQEFGIIEVFTQGFGRSTKRYRLSRSYKARKIAIEDIL